MGEAAHRVQGSPEVTDRLLDSALTVFGERGYDAATVADIARRCGLTTGAIYARWPTKRELFIDVIEHTSAQRMLLLIKNLDVTASEKLTMLATMLIATTRDATRNLWTEACVSAGRDPSLRSIVAQRLELEAGDLEGIIAEGKAAGTIDPSLSDAALVFLCQSLGLGTHLTARVRAEERPRPSDEDWAPVMERLIRAIGPQN